MRPSLRYRTEPLKCWQKAKELRADNFEKLIEAKEQGRLVIGGSVHVPRQLFAGIEDYTFFPGESWSTTISTFPELAEECVEAAENKGFARDLCAYTRLCLGSMFLNKSPWGQFPKPDIIVQEQRCDSHGKWFQLIAEHLGIPSFMLESYQNFEQLHEPAADSQKANERGIRYMESQYHDLIEWLEKVSGRRYEDEKVIEAVLTSRRIKVLYDRIVDCQKAIPAPLDMKSLLVLVAPRVQVGADKKVEDFYKILLDEVRWRVENQIAAVPVERCRLFYGGQAPWYTVGTLRHVNGWGATFIGNYGTFLLGDLGAGEVAQGPSRTYEEMGRVPRNREEAVRLLAREQSGTWGCIEARVNEMCQVIDGWDIDGIVFHFDRGCEGNTLGMSEIKLAVTTKYHIPTLSYEGSRADRRDWNEAQALDRLESFLEGTLGLTRLQD